MAASIALMEGDQRSRRVPGWHDAGVGFRAASLPVRELLAMQAMFLCVVERTPRRVRLRAAMFCRTCRGDADDGPLDAWCLLVMPIDRAVEVSRVVAMPGATAGMICVGVIGRFAGWIALVPGRPDSGARADR